MFIMNPTQMTTWSHDVCCELLHSDMLRCWLWTPSKAPTYSAQTHNIPISLLKSIFYQEYREVQTGFCEASKYWFGVSFGLLLFYAACLSTCIQATLCPSFSATQALRQDVTSHCRQVRNQTEISAGMISAKTALTYHLSPSQVFSLGDEIKRILISASNHLSTLDIIVVVRQGKLRSFSQCRSS